MQLRRRLKYKLRRLMGNDTQDVFARKIGVGQGSLNRILKGKQDVGIDLIEKICKFTGIRVEDLLGSSDDKAIEQFESRDPNASSPSTSEVNPL